MRWKAPARTSSTRLFRDQGNSAYVRDTGDPTTPEGGLLEWGYYEPFEPRIVEATDISEPEDARMSPSMNDLTLDQVIEAFERSVELTPVLAELPWEERRSFQWSALCDHRRWLDHR